MEAGSGYILEVQFNPAEDFTVEFYVERERSVKFSRDELVRVTTEEGEKLYAMIDSSRVGRGNLMCRAEVYDKEAHWGMRPVVLKGFTGYSVGNCLCGVGGGFGCDGYSFAFKGVRDIPKDINSKIYYGVLKSRVVGYEFITEQMVLDELTMTEVKPMDISMNVEAGDRVVVVIPYEEHMKATKTVAVKGFSATKLPFNTEVMGANGEIVLFVDRIKCRVYGGFQLVKSVININIS